MENDNLHSRDKEKKGWGFRSKSDDFQLEEIKESFLKELNFGQIWKIIKILMCENSGGITKIFYVEKTL